MKNSQWIIFAVALAMIAGTAGMIVHFQGRLVLGKPGVKVDNIPSIGEDLKPARPQSVPLPAQVLDAKSQVMPIANAELDGLPKDTTFGRRQYAKPV